MTVITKIGCISALTNPKNNYEKTHYQCKEDVHKINQDFIAKNKTWFSSTKTCEGTHKLQNYKGNRTKKHGNLK